MSDIALPINGVPELPRGERLLSDERLAKLASRGSARAFAALYERHHQTIYRYCRSIVRNDHDAQDALQSAMTRAYAALCARERDLAVRPWLFRIAHNEAISILRRRSREDELVDGREPADGGVERTVAVRERLSTLLADLRELPERQRAALLMRELSGLSIEEIAGALSVSTGAAKQTLFEARSSLHELAEGRAMECEAVRRAVSERDGRVLRGRKLRAHLRDCAGCREFRELIDTRGADLRALAPPLPATLASATLARLLAGGGGGHAGGATATAGSALGGHAAASLMAKGLAGVAVMAAATAGTVHLTAGHGGSAHRSKDAVSARGHAQAHSNVPARTLTSGDAKRAGRSLTPTISTPTSAAALPPGANGSVSGRQAPAGGRHGQDRSSQNAHGNTKAGSHGARSHAHHATGSGGEARRHGRSSPKPAKHSPHGHRPPGPVRPSTSPGRQGSHGRKPTQPSSASGNGAGEGAQAPPPHRAPTGTASTATGRAIE